MRKPVMLGILVVFLSACTASPAPKPNTAAVGVPLVAATDFLSGQQLECHTGEPHYLTVPDSLTGGREVRTPEQLAAGLLAQLTTPGVENVGGRLTMATPSPSQRVFTFVNGRGHRTLVVLVTNWPDAGWGVTAVGDCAGE